jgi:SAM-dependent methyltransferase
LTLLSRSLAFYRHVWSMQSAHGSGASPTTRILDFGCRWGRLTRFFCRDVDLGCLHACDPDEDLLKLFSRSRLPAVLHRAELASGELPEGDFDLAYSHSLFTRLGEQEAAAALEALAEALSPAGLLILTIRPPAGPGNDPATTLPYLREHWGDRFELVDVTVLLEDIDQVAVTLQRS